MNISIEFDVRNKMKYINILIIFYLVLLRIKRKLRMDNEMKNII